MAIGAAIVLALTFAPYALMKDARRAAAYIQIPLKHATAAAPESESTVAAPAPTPAAAPAPAPAFDVAGWYAGRGDDPSRHALLVQSLDGRVTLAEQNADVTYNPASLVKLTTSLTVLHKLG